MNKTKSNIILTAAILSIVSGGILFFSFCYVVLMIYAYSLSGFTLLFYLDFLVAAAMIILGSLLCKKRSSKPIIITLIVLFAVYTVVAFVNVINGSGILSLLLFITTLAMLITGLSLPNTAPAASAATTATPSIELSPIDEIQKKIQLLKQLRFDGQISEEEYKTLLLRELEK